jgi:rubrerythrin
MGHGKGTFTFKDGSEYVGPIKEGNMHGNGIFKFHDGTIKQVIYENGNYIGEVQQNVSSSSNNNLNYTKQVLDAYNQLSDFANKNGISLSNESKTSTWQCNYCGSVAHKKEKPWSQFGGKCPNNGVEHNWEMAEKQVHWQCDKCGSVAHKKEKPWSQFGGKCPNNGVEHTWNRVE